MSYPGLTRGRYRLTTVRAAGLLVVLTAPFLIVYTAALLQDVDLQASSMAADLAVQRINTARADYRNLNCDNPNELSSHPGLPARCEELLSRYDHKLIVTAECAGYVNGARYVFGLLSSSTVVSFLVAVSAAVAVWGILWWASVKLGDDTYNYHTWRQAPAEDTGRVTTSAETRHVTWRAPEMPLGEGILVGGGGDGSHSKHE